ncbi:hypothetical protein ThidrDRAFT_4402 [Thiorhodococcus drewsii AZ1]|uniref:Uncharacterized protein n=1 Tax=Thiorhodococcus drewsii AZ1 TaxID=765913 RepID=G2E7Y8_9GAMM|nr:hypothetical protein ThidrDRAFT_4402 [Thiorhodococcus drewsii AZ1]
MTVPHPKADIPLPTLRSIHRQAGWPWKCFMRFALALHTDDGVAYGVTVPDLSGAVWAASEAMRKDG